MNAPAKIGDNMPPDPIDDALGPFADIIAESENWLDGAPVENEIQMKEVDALLKGIKAAKKAVGDAEESEAKPIYDQWKAAKARFAPTITDLDRIAKGLVSIVDVFKRKLAAEKAEAERLARVEAERKLREFQEAHRAAAAGDIEAQRAAAAAEEAAKDAARAAALASKDTVKGMRTVTRYEITDHRALLNYIAKNHRDDVTAFIDEFAKNNHRSIPDGNGIRTWTDREAF